MAGEKNPEKVEFELDESKLLRLRFSEPRTGDGEYGTWWLYGADEWDEINKVWKQVSWFTNERVAAILKDWKAKKGDEFLLWKKAGENPETKKPFFYFVIYNKKTKETKSTKDMASTPTEEIPEEPPTGIAPENSPCNRESFDILLNLIGDIKEVMKRNDCEIPEGFALTLLNCDGFWRTWNTLIMQQGKMNGR